MAPDHTLIPSCVTSALVPALVLWGGRATSCDNPAEARKETTDHGRARRHDGRTSFHRTRRRGNGAAARLRRGAGEHPGSLHGRSPGGKASIDEQLLAAHPELATQLEACLAGIEFIHRATGPATQEPAILGEFRIIRELGRGGMGVVYEAEQTSLRRHVALKVLRFGVVADEEAMKRFQREAETVARLHHTNIVPIFAVGCERGVHYYAMQFIDGPQPGRRPGRIAANGQAAARPTTSLAGAFRRPRPWPMPISAG